MAYLRSSTPRTPQNTPMSVKIVLTPASWNDAPGNPIPKEKATAVNVPTEAQLRLPRANNITNKESAKRVGERMGPAVATRVPIPIAAPTVKQTINKVRPAGATGSPSINAIRSAPRTVQNSANSWIAMAKTIGATTKIPPTTPSEGLNGDLSIRVKSFTKLGALVKIGSLIGKRFAPCF